VPSFGRLLMTAPFDLKEMSAGIAGGLRDTGF